MGRGGGGGGGEGKKKKKTQKKKKEEKMKRKTEKKGRGAREGSVSLVRACGGGGLHDNDGRRIIVVIMTRGSLISIMA